MMHVIASVLQVPDTACYSTLSLHMRALNLSICVA